MVGHNVALFIVSPLINFIISFLFIQLIQLKFHFGNIKWRTQRQIYEIWWVWTGWAHNECATKVRDHLLTLQRTRTKYKTYKHDKHCLNFNLKLWMLFSEFHTRHTRSIFLFTVNTSDLDLNAKITQMLHYTFCRCLLIVLDKLVIIIVNFFSINFFFLLVRWLYSGWSFRFRL